MSPPRGSSTRAARVAAALVVVLAAGASALGNLPRLEDPRITLRNAIVLTPYPGASAARVESLVSKKLEDRLREVVEIKEIESTSRTGMSVLSIELADDVVVTRRDRNQVVDLVMFEISVYEPNHL